MRRSRRRSSAGEEKISGIKAQALISSLSIDERCRCESSQKKVIGNFFISIFIKNKNILFKNSKCGVVRKGSNKENEI